MRAIVVREFGPPEVMKLEQVPDPTAGPTQVLVRTRAIGVNPVETYIRAGTYTRRPNLPVTVGNDMAGVVEAVGQNVTSVKPGDRVYTHGTVTGAYAELALAEEPQVHPLHDRLTFQQGAAIGVPYGTAWRALFLKVNARPGETALIHGASGGVGIAATQIARAAGLRVIGTAGTEKGLQLVKEQGAHFVLNHRESNYLEQVLLLSEGRGADVILEMLTNVNLDRDFGVLALRGRIMVIGNRGRIEIDPGTLMTKDGAIFAMRMFNATADDYRIIHAALGAGFESGALTPVVGREMPLSEAVQAHKAVLEPGAYGKIVMIP
jgi:NADPH2:quinone reductase